MVHAGITNAEYLPPREINRLHMRVMGSVRRKIALEVQGIALVGTACTAGDKEGVLVGWLEKMGAPPVIKRVDADEDEPDQDMEENDAAMAAAIKVAMKHVQRLSLPAELGPKVVD